MTLAAEDLNAAVRLPTDRWRLITGYDRSGAYNMALDEALLASVIAGGQPVIRFYTWQPFTLSLGVNQPLGEVDLAACAARGFTLVRRLTGGRAVLHQHELTYSLIARENDLRVSGGVVESYRKISAALVTGLRTLGADVALAEPSPELYRALAESMRPRVLDEHVESESSHAVCFDTASAYELTARGKKLVGSAQARRSGVVLQHGSILLDIDWDAWVSVFAYASEAGRQRAYTKLPTRMTSLREELGREVRPAELADVLHRAFEQELNIDLVPGEPGEDEEIHVAQLAFEKYGRDEWTSRV